jgi:hypothetical protein
MNGILAYSAGPHKPSSLTTIQRPPQSTQYRAQRNGWPDWLIAAFQSDMLQLLQQLECAPWA